MLDIKKLLDEIRTREINAVSRRIPAVHRRLRILRLPKNNRKVGRRESIKSARQELKALKWQLDYLRRDARGEFD